MKALRIITTLSLGITAGLVAGYLTAPRSGKKTRQRISDEVDSQMKSIEDTYKNQISKLKKDYNEQVKELTHTGKDVLNKTKEMISAN